MALKREKGLNILDENEKREKLLGGAVRNRTAVRNLATLNIYMFRKVV